MAPWDIQLAGHFFANSQNSAALQREWNNIEEYLVLILRHQQASATVQWDTALNIMT